VAFIAGLCVLGPKHRIFSYLTEKTASSVFAVPPQARSLARRPRSSIFSSDFGSSQRPRKSSCVLGPEARYFLSRPARAISQDGLAFGPSTVFLLFLRPPRIKDLASIGLCVPGPEARYFLLRPSHAKTLQHESCVLGPKHLHFLSYLWPCLVSLCSGLKLHSVFFSYLVFRRKDPAALVLRARPLLSVLRTRPLKHGIFLLLFLRLH
jgi:hypothetical protein